MTYDDFDHESEDEVKEQTIDYDSIITYTDLAILFRLPTGREEWLPKSQITVFEGNKTVQIAGWLYLKKKL